MKCGRIGILLGAVLMLAASSAHAGSYVKEFYLTTGGGATQINRYTKGDTTQIVTDPIPVFGAKMVIVVASTEFARAYTGADTTYTDSVSVFNCTQTFDDTTYATFAMCSGNRFTTYVLSAPALSTTQTLSKTYNSGGLGIVIYGSPQSGTAGFTTPITWKKVRFAITPINRTTIGGWPVPPASELLGSMV